MSNHRPSIDRPSIDRSSECAHVNHRPASDFLGYRKFALRPMPIHVGQHAIIVQMMLEFLSVLLGEDESVHNKNLKNKN